MQAISNMVISTRERAIKQKLLSALSPGTGAAATLAALLSQKDPNSIIAEARGRFRCISWETLRAMPEIICAPDTLDGQNTSSIAHLHALSKSCEFGECDAFLSHSWHDDAYLKWDALSDICTNFELVNQRSPRLWLDKVCIDQKNIQATKGLHPTRRSPHIWKHR